MCFLPLRNNVNVVKRCPKLNWTSIQQTGNSTGPHIFLLAQGQGATVRVEPCILKYYVGWNIFGCVFCQIFFMAAIEWMLMF